MTFTVAGLNESTHPWGSATVTSYAPGVHPFPTVFPL